MLKSNPNILRENVPFNLEADSLNCIVLGDDVTPGNAGMEYFYKRSKKRNDFKSRAKMYGYTQDFCS